jgi:hypothetical protein
VAVVGSQIPVYRIEENEILLFSPKDITTFYFLSLFFRIPFSSIPMKLSTAAAAATATAVAVLLCTAQQHGATGFVSPLRTLSFVSSRVIANNHPQLFMSSNVDEAPTTTVPAAQTYE